VIKDHRPYYLKRLSHAFEQWYANHFLAPQCEHFGRHLVFMKPWGVEIYGNPVSIGDYTTLIATMDRRIRLTSWIANGKSGKVEIGRHCLICPGTRIQAATAITIGDDCMMAQNVCITDADWHDLYDRSVAIGQTREVVISTNVWVGDSAMVCKGVAIGENSIVGAGAVVLKDVPPNVVVGGNPAVIVKNLDPEQKMKTRAEWFSRPELLAAEFAAIDRQLMKGNTWHGWLRAIFFPNRSD